MDELPLPPAEMRALVGPLEDAAYENPERTPIVTGLPAAAWESVFDFGCGCGRLARRMALQVPRPGSYVGVDLHLGMVQWARRELGSRLGGFEFHHVDIRNAGLNPGGRLEMAPFPVADGTVSLFLAWSVFTHITERAAGFYLGELARVLRRDGIAMTTWFLFEKSCFPMMQNFQNALYINESDPTNAVIYDKVWLRARAEERGLRLAAIEPPEIHGFQWVIRIEPDPERRGSVPFPRDGARAGSIPPPLLPPGAARIGLIDGES